MFNEPGVKIKNKASGKGRSKEAGEKKEKELKRKVEKIYKKERRRGDALPAVLKDLALTTSLR